MKNTPEYHTSPKCPQRQYGYLLEVGDTVQADDVYDSTAGGWQLLPGAAGCKLSAAPSASSVLWVRPCEPPHMVDLPFPKAPRRMSNTERQLWLMSYAASRSLPAALAPIPCSPRVHTVKASDVQIWIGPAQIAGPTLDPRACTPARPITLVSSPRRDPAAYEQAAARFWGTVHEAGGLGSSTWPPPNTGWAKGVRAAVAELLHSAQPAPREQPVTPGYIEETIARLKREALHTPRERLESTLAQASSDVAQLPDFVREACGLPRVQDPPPPAGPEPRCDGCARFRSVCLNRPCWRGHR